MRWQDANDQRPRGAGEARFVLSSLLIGAVALNEEGLAFLGSTLDRLGLQLAAAIAVSDLLGDQLNGGRGALLAAWARGPNIRHEREHE